MAAEIIAEVEGENSAPASRIPIFRSLRRSRVIASFGIKMLYKNEEIRE
jgi:hypothetical protein